MYFDVITYMIRAGLPTYFDYGPYGSVLTFVKLIVVVIVIWDIRKRQVRDSTAWMIIILATGITGALLYRYLGQHRLMSDPGSDKSKKINPLNVAAALLAIGTAVVVTLVIVVTVLFK